MAITCLVTLTILEMICESSGIESFLVVSSGDGVTLLALAVDVTVIGAQSDLNQFIVFMLMYHHCQKKNRT